MTKNKKPILKNKYLDVDLDTLDPNERELALRYMRQQGICYRCKKQFERLQRHLDSEVCLTKCWLCSEEFPDSKTRAEHEDSCPLPEGSQQLRIAFRLMPEFYMHILADNIKEFKPRILEYRERVINELKQIMVYFNIDHSKTRTQDNGVVLNTAQTMFVVYMEWAVKNNCHEIESFEENGIGYHKLVNEEPIPVNRVVIPETPKPPTPSSTLSSTLTQDNHGQNGEDMQERKEDEGDGKGDGEGEKEEAENGNLYNGLVGREFRSPNDLLEITVQEGYNNFYNDFMALSNSNSINKKLDKVGLMTPEQIYKFVRENVHEKTMQKIRDKLSDHPDYGNLFKKKQQLHNMIEFKRRRGESYRLEELELKEVDQSMIEIRRKSKIYIDSQKDEQGRYIGLKEGDYLDLMELVNSGNVLKVLNDMSAIGMASDLLDTLTNFVDKMFIQNREYDDIPIKIKDYKRVRFEFQTPDRAWHSDQGGYDVAKMICMSMCKSLLICAVIYPELMLRENREVEKNNLMNHFDLSYVQKNLNLLHSKKFHIKFIKRIMNILQNREHNDSC